MDIGELNERRRWAREASVQLFEGRLVSVARALGRRWGAGRESLCLVPVLADLTLDPPKPPARVVVPLLADGSDLPDPPAAGSLAGRLRWLQAQPDLPDMRLTVADRLTWALLDLDLLGEDLLRTELHDWNGHSSFLDDEDDPRDARTLHLFEAWQRGAAWDIKEAWETLFLQEAERVFIGVMEAQHISREHQRRIRRDLRRAFFFVMQNSRLPLPGWVVVAARVLETGPRGPLEELGAMLGPEHRRWAGACLATRGGRSVTLERLFPDLAYPAARAELATSAMQDPTWWWGFQAAHVTLRVSRAWRKGASHSLEAQRHLALQSTSKLRARLRALVGQRTTDAHDPLPSLRPALIARLGRLSSLYQRTAWAVRATARTWALNELRLGMPLHIDRPLLPPCLKVEHDGPQPFPEALRALTMCWILLVVLRGRLPHLLDWVRNGGTGTNDGTWNRLLAKHLPGELCGPGRGRDRYHRLRFSLTFWLDGCLRELGPLISRIALLEPMLETARRRRGLSKELRPMLQGLWDDRVGFPSGGYPTAVEACVEAVPVLVDEGWLRLEG